MFIKKILKYRWIVVISLTIISVVIGFQLKFAEIDPEIDAMIPEDFPSRLNTKKIEDLFGSNEMVLIMFEGEDIINNESLKRIKKIDKLIERVDGIDRTMSPFNSKKIIGEDGMMIVEPAIKRIPIDNSDIEKLKSDLAENELVYGVTVSKDFKMAAIIALIDNEVEQTGLINEIETIIADNPGNDKIFLGGLPIVKKAISSDIMKDVKYLIPIAIALMLIVLFVSFRKFYGVFLPFAVVVLSIFFGFGLLPVFGWKMTLISILLPILIIAIANDYGIHLVAKFKELVDKEEKPNSKRIAIETFESLKTPIILTGITTIAGILCLLMHIIIPAKQVGVLAALGIAWALILSLLFIPSILSSLKMQKSRKVNGAEAKPNKFEQMLIATGKFVGNKPKTVIISFILITLFLGIGIVRVKVDGNNENFFKESHIVKQSSNKLNEHFGGTQNISILFSGDIKDPALLKKMDYYEQELKEFPGVGNVMSLASVLKIMSKALNDPGDEYYNKIPPSREAVAQYLELYNMNGNPEDFEQMVDFDYENAHFIIRLNNSDSYVILDVVNKVKELIKNDPNAKMIGGYGLIGAEITQKIIRGQIISLVVAILVITILLMIIFNSFIAGILGSIPLTMALTILFGLMGLFGIKLDAATAMISSIMIGLGVDYTIHFFWRYKEELAKGLDEKTAIIVTLSTTGKGIIYNALSVIIGFSALLFSSFLPIQFFGFLVIVSIVTCLIASLVFIPALCLIWKPNFLRNGKIKKTVSYRKSVRLSLAHIHAK